MSYWGENPWKMGRSTGSEPATSGTTNRRSNQLSYDRHTKQSGPLSESSIQRKCVAMAVRTGHGQAMRKYLILFFILPLSGCVASAAKTVVTAPFKVVGKAVDLATTSQSEADENRGRKMRKEEEKARKQARKERH